MWTQSNVILVGTERGDIPYALQSRCGMDSS